MFRLRFFLWLTGLAAVVLAACGGSASPQLIGSYPKGSGASSTYAPPPSNLLVVYNAYLDLEVADTDRAAQRATDLTYNYGGYLVSSQSWYQDNRKHTTLTLAVPVAQFESTRQALLDLGKLQSESVSGDLVNTCCGADSWNIFSNITLQLHPAPPTFRLPSLPNIGWSPAHTFESAFGVFAALFTFLVDIVIWAAVVVGPFVLLGVGLRALWRRFHP
jgi:hypothetical protein